MKARIWIFAAVILFCGLVTTQAEQQQSYDDSNAISVDLSYQEPALEVAVEFLDPDGNNLLDAEQTAQVIVTVTNNGGPAHNIAVELAPIGQVRHISVTEKQNIPGLKTGESQKLTFQLSAAFEIQTGQAAFRVDVRDAEGNQARPVELQIATAEFRAPKLAVTDWGIDDSGAGSSFGNGNGRAERGETVEITAVVQNQGQGRAQNVTADIAVPEGIFFMGQKRINLGDLEPGDFRKLKFSFTIRMDYAGGEQLPFALQLSEARGSYGHQEAMNVTIGRQARLAGEVAEPERVVVQGQAPDEVAIGAAPTVRVDVDEDIPATGASNPNAFAVIIGNRNYRHQGAPNVDYAIRDAQMMREYLIKVLGYKPGNIRLLTDATKAQFEATFGTAGNHRGWLFNQVKPERSDVFVYYSGHGAPDVNTGQAYLVPADADPGALAFNGYNLETLYKNLAQIPARNMTIVLDTCFSGGTATGQMLVAAASPLHLDAQTSAPANAETFTSTGPGQVSSWYPQMRHGLFTYFFLKGLRGAADRNGDHKITAGEMKQYLTDRAEGVPYYARSLHGRDQNPTMQGDEDRVIAEY
ncbi:MAG: caspase family protein [Alphaproteobacteria bacterium]